MSLYTEALTECVMRVQTAVLDGSGGYTSVWADGTTFYAAITKDESTQARIAAVQGVTDHYNVLTAKDTCLNYHDVFKRVSDGKLFRVTTNGSDKATPASAGLNMRQVKAEDWNE